MPAVNATDLGPVPIIKINDNKFYLWAPFKTLNLQHKATRKVLKGQDNKNIKHMERLKQDHM